MKSSRLGLRKIITRSLEYELQPGQRERWGAQTTKSKPNNQSKQSSLISETFKPRTFK
jgi:hypothetical protein